MFRCLSPSRKRRVGEVREDGRERVGVGGETLRCVGKKSVENHSEIFPEKFIVSAQEPNG